MSVACIQCAMKAMVDGQPATMFDETVEEHMRRVHPDPLATYRERQQLEAQLFERGLLPPGMLGKPTH